MSHLAQSCTQPKQYRDSIKSWRHIEVNFTISFDNKHRTKLTTWTGIVDGMSIIDLGCGWGSVSIYLASKFPNCKITSVSNSHSQKVFIMGRAAERGYKNINVYTGDISSIYIASYLHHIYFLKYITNYMKELY